MKEIIPGNWRFEIRESRPSKFVKGEMIDEVVGYRCPACSVVHNGLSHGQSRECLCGLTITVMGAAIELSDE